MGLPNDTIFKLELRKYSILKTNAIVFIKYFITFSKRDVSFYSSFFFCLSSCKTRIISGLSYGIRLNDFYKLKYNVPRKSVSF